MRSLIRPGFLAVSVVVACGGLSGCSNEAENPSGKMDTGKMGGPMDKMDTGKMDSGKMGGPMDKMEKNKMQ